jgi:conjugal transfer pilin signal peptidase TrbI
MVCPVVLASSALDRPHSAPRKHSVRKRLIMMAVLGAAGIGLTGIAQWKEHHAILINASESLPNWAFLVETGKFPQRGEFVIFDPPLSPLVVGHFGAKPQPFAKITFGVAGDIVTRRGRDVLVNSKLVGRVKPFSRLGEPLALGPVGVIPENCVYAGTPHPDGFDSRYAAIGFICRDRIIGVGSSVL